MSQNFTIEFEFSIDDSIVTRFAQLTGDYNSMHMNPEVARKSKYRRTIVHGMISFSFIQFLQSEFGNQEVLFTCLSAKFAKPVFTGDRLKLAINYQVQGEVGQFDAVWTLDKSEEVVTKCKGEFKLIHLSEPIRVISEDNASSFIFGKISENQYLITDLNDQSETIDFKIDKSAQYQYVNSILNHAVSSNVLLDRLCSNLSAVLMLSTMVGMKLPGRYAIFEQFQVSFEHKILVGHNYSLKSSLSKVSVPVESMTAAVVIEDDKEIANGKVSVLLNSPPKEMISSQEIIHKYLDFGVSNKVVLITGASRGIGETTAKLFGAFGAKVVVNYYQGKEDAEAIVDEIKVSGGNAICIQCDVANTVSVTNMVTQIMTFYGSLDILINNAVKDFSPKEIIDMEWNDYQEELNVSLKGLHNCCKSVIPIFKDNGGGKIINISSVAVDNPVSGQSRYITAKSAVTGYTKSLAKELIKYNINANLVVPNMTDTDLVSGFPAMIKEKIAQSRPYGRHVFPIEVAQSILFLSSSWSNAITGQKIVLNLGEPPFA